MKKDRQTHRQIGAMGLGGLNTLMEKWQDLGSSMYLLYRLEQRWGCCIQLKKEARCMVYS